AATTSGDGGVDDAGDVTVIDEACPTAPPTAGDTCTLKQECEYGGTGEHRRCSTKFNCQKNVWVEDPPFSGCLRTQADNDPKCPATISALPNGSKCPNVVIGECLYPEGACGCIGCLGPDGGVAGDDWQCATWDAPNGCPEPRPAMGSACSTEG